MRRPLCSSVSLRRHRHQPHHQRLRGSGSLSSVPSLGCYRLGLRTTRLLRRNPPLAQLRSNRGPLFHSLDGEVVRPRRCSQLFWFGPNSGGGRPAHSPSVESHLSSVRLRNLETGNVVDRRTDESGHWTGMPLFQRRSELDRCQVDDEWLGKHQCRQLEPLPRSEGCLPQVTLIYKLCSCVRCSGSVGRISSRKPPLLGSGTKFNNLHRR